MESSVVCRSFNGAPQSVTHVKSFLAKSAAVPISRDATRQYLSFQVPGQCRELTITKSSRKGSQLFSVKPAQATIALTSDAVPSERAPQGPSESKNIQKLTFPNGFEALVLEVCDATNVAELKLKASSSMLVKALSNANWILNYLITIIVLKVGQFELHLKRDVGSPAASAPIATPVSATLPPAPSKPKVESGSSVPQATPKESIPTSTSPFANVSSKASKLAALEVSGSNVYALVSSPTVGLFRSGRTLKGKKQPPSSKEGDMIKEGQVIGFLDQFGSELPIKSDVAGEVLKVLCMDGEPVGYGDPLVAVLPSFIGIK